MKNSSFQLMGKPRIISFFYETNRKFKFSESLPLAVTNNIRVVKSNDESVRNAVVIAKIGIFTEPNLEQVPFQIRVEIEGCFKWDDELQNNNALLETMLKQNAPAILFSYVRPLITLITVEANMPPLVIPLMNFTE